MGVEGGRKKEEGGRRKVEEDGGEVVEKGGRWRVEEDAGEVVERRRSQEGGRRSKGSERVREEGWA